MITLLAKLFIPDPKNYGDPDVRRKYGILCGIVGILLNLFLFVGKLLAGIIAASIAITADAFNNLTDAGSSVITLVGFRLAGQKPDPQHPFGHGRVEYISGLFVSVIILLMGFELGKSSVEKLLHPEPEAPFSWIPVIILGISVAVKLYMGLYNRSVGIKIRSAAMKATMTDSMSDAVATTVVLISAILSRFTDFNIDGWCGLAVAVMIFIAGFRAAKETVSPLLGQPPEPEYVKRIEQIVLSHETVSGIHDLIVNDYGPGRRIISLHAEVSADESIWDAHDAIDNIEGDLARELGCLAVIHMDPISTQDEETNRLRHALAERCREIDPGMTVHDLRTVPGPTHTNVIFDAVLPLGSGISEKEAKARLTEIVREINPDARAVIRIDRSYV